jgi:cell wall-associated NlpC family hydrolase
MKEANVPSRSARFIRKLCLTTLFSSAAAIARADGTPAVQHAVSLDALVQQLTDSARQVASTASDVVITAMGMLGVRYTFGGNTPESGLDCSGLVRLAFAQTFGMNLPRTSREMSRVGDDISRRELQPGDLVFFNTLRRAFSHVGIYVGDGKFVHAPSTGGEVRVESMNIPYWQNRFNGARRIAPENMVAQAPSTFRVPAIPTPLLDFAHPGDWQAP